MFCRDKHLFLSHSFVATKMLLVAAAANDSRQTPEHVLQSCPLYKEARTHHWPQGATLAIRLWGSKEDLLLRASLSSTFIQTLPELVTPLKRHFSPPRRCPPMVSARSERLDTSKTVEATQSPSTHVNIRRIRTG